MSERTIGDAIRELRTESGITQAELAARLNVTPQIISQYERGVKKPKIETVAKIAKALGKDNKALYYFYGSGDYVGPILDREHSALSQLAYTVFFEEYKMKNNGVVATPEMRKDIIDKVAPVFAKRYLVPVELIKTDYETISRMIDHYAAELEAEERIESLKYYPENEEQLKSAFQKLNNLGQKVAIERVEELTEIPKYQRIDEEADDIDDETLNEE